MANAKKKTTTKKRSTKAFAAKKRAIAKNNQSDFWAIQFNAETLYWLIFGVVVVAIGVWTFTTAQQVHEIYNNMETQETIIVEAPVKKSTE